MRHTCSPRPGDMVKREECLACRAQDSVPCTCPEWWFPRERAFTLRQLPHGYGGGMLAHHVGCAKAKT